MVRGGDVLRIAVDCPAGYEAEVLTEGLRKNADGTYMVTAQKGDKTPAVEVRLDNAVPATPEFSVEPGTVLWGEEVTLSTSAGADIYYTTDGNEPTEASIPYTAPIAIKSPEVTIKAVAVNGSYTSEVSTATYRLQAHTLQVNAQIENGTVRLYVADQNGLTLTSASGGTASGTVYMGQTVKMQVEPDNGCRLLRLAYTYSNYSNQNGLLAPSRDGLTPASTFTQEFTMPDAGVLVSAAFEQKAQGAGESTWIMEPSEQTGPDGSVEKALDISEAVEILTISTAEDMRTLAEGVNAGLTYKDKEVKVVADIDLTQLDHWTPIGWVDAASTADGRFPNHFDGTFDGQGHTFTLAYENDTGNYLNDTIPSTLFWCAQNAVIKNINIRAGESGKVCGPTILFMAYNISNVSISNCVNYADVVGWRPSFNPTPAAEEDYEAYAAGIAYNAGSGTISDCLNFGDIVNEYPDYYYRDDAKPTEEWYGSCVGYAAGICVNAANGTLLRCGNYGDVYGGISPNGAVAMGRARTVQECFNKGNLYVGGKGQFQNFAISAGSTMTDCYNTGNVTVVGMGGLNTHNWVSGLWAFSSIVNGYNAGGLDGSLMLEHWEKNTYQTFNYTMVVQDFFAGVLDSTTMKGTLTNTYGQGEAVDAAALNAGVIDENAKWKDDVNSINGGYPLLWWESDEVDATEYTASFTVTPANASITVARVTADGEEAVQPNSDGTYTVYQGRYSYTVSASGYITETGTFNVQGGDVARTVTLTEAAEMRFQVKPAQASFVLTDESGRTVAEQARTASGEYMVYTFSLPVGTSYSYTASCEGWNDTTHGITVQSGGGVELVELTASSFGKPAEGETEARYIWGDWNEDKAHTISAGGTYSVAPEAYGTITIATSEPVTLVGQGVSVNTAYEYLFIDCTTSNTNLTLRDIYIRNDQEDLDPVHGDYRSNMIRFAPGSTNSLYCAGTCCLDLDTNASGYAAIYVPTGVTLNLRADTLYLYKNEQGAGIGGNGGASVTNPDGSAGQSAEYNGNINIGPGLYFMKGSSQGATIGSGANASSTSGAPGSIVIASGARLYGIQVSRGAFIGGSAGSSGGAEGADVTIEPGAMVSINVDYTGAAIGGGGYASGNDAAGGRIYYNGGSVRTYADVNAVEADGTNPWAAYGITEPGVDERVITAGMFSPSGQVVYPLVFDTSALSGSSSTFTVLDGTRTIYTGGLCGYYFLNESRQKDGQYKVSYTWDNWLPRTDTNLYLFLTAGEHKLTINGQQFTATWLEDTDPADRIFFRIVNDDTGKVVNNASTVVLPSGTTEEARLETATTVTGEKAVTTFSSESLAQVLEQTEAGTQLVVSADIPQGETVTETAAVLTRGDAGAIAQAGASLKVSSPLAEITLSTQALQDLAGQTGQEAQPVAVTAAVQEDGVRIELAVNGQTADTVEGGLLVSLPAQAEALSAGTVMVLVDAEGNETVIKKSAVGEDCVLALVDGSCTVKVVDNTRTFDDVYETHWYAGAVAFAAGHELFKGISETEFDPTGLMTRGMLVTVLHRLEDTPDPLAPGTFGDVEADSWFTGAVHWASENGIVTGYDEYSYGPYDSITREQMAVMMYRYVKWMGLETTAAGDLDGYADRGVISDWAEEAIVWAVGAGLMEGKSESELDPAGTATRAEVATILQRLINLLVQ